MMTGKMIGSIFLIIGTAVGGVILALPMITAQAGFPFAALLFVCVWFVMTMGSLYLMESSLWFPAGNNLIMLSQKTLGPVGKWMTWVVYLALLYSLVSAYLSGGIDILSHGFGLLHWQTSNAAYLIMILLVFVPLVYRGINTVDWVNRGFMTVKLSALVILIGLLSMHIQVPRLLTLHPSGMSSAVVPVITAFGYAILTPSLRDYFDGHPKTLRTVVIVGSLIPLFAYIFWVAVVRGAVPTAGPQGLIQIEQASNPVGMLLNALRTQLHSPMVSYFANIFVSVSIITTFLGVTLSLRDFLIDGMGLDASRSRHRSVAIILTFGPPLLIVLFYPAIFILALRYAGLMCILLLILLPALIVFSGRYRKKLASGYEVFGGRMMIWFEIVIGVALFIFGMGHLL